MTVNDIYNKLVSEAENKWNPTCDGVLAGDGNKEVKKAAACFKATANAVDEAIKAGADLLITHEPLYTNDFEFDENDIIDVKKREMIEKSGIAIMRFHDHAHETNPDYIHKGFIDALGLEIEKEYPRESLGIRRYVLKEKTTALEFSKKVKKALNTNTARLAGDENVPVKTICLALGGIGLPQAKLLMSTDCDLLVTGEIGEVISCSYIGEMNFFGYKKAMLLLGHCTSEYNGMKVLADYLTKEGIPTEFIFVPEFYSIVK